MKKEELHTSSNSAASWPANINFSPSMLEVEFENKIKMQIAFYRSSL